MSRTMTTSALATLVAACLVVTSQAQGLSDAQVADAIKAGQSKKFDHLVSECDAKGGFGEGLRAGLVGGVQQTGHYDVTLSASAGRIAYLAAQAKRLYKPFTLESVTPEMRSPFVIVSVEPHKPYRDDDGVTVSAPIEHVVLKSKTNENVAIQPSRVDLEVVAFASVPGGKFESNRAVALFSYDAVRELPPGEFDIVVITAPGERRCKVGIGDSLKAVPEESMSVGFRPVGLRRPGDRSRRAK